MCGESVCMVAGIKPWTKPHTCRSDTARERLMLPAGAPGRDWAQLLTGGGLHPRPQACYPCVTALLPAPGLHPNLCLTHTHSLSLRNHHPTTHPCAHT